MNFTIFSNTEKFFFFACFLCCSAAFGRPVDLCIEAIKDTTGFIEKEQFVKKENQSFGVINFTWREEEITCVASKKTFVKKALADVGMDIDTKQFDGAPAVFIGLEDEVAPAQIVANFAKDHKMMTIFGGILEGQFISEAKVTELSKLPSKQQLLGQLVGTLNAPISGFVNVLAGNLRGLVTVLSAIKEQKA